MQATVVRRSSTARSVWLDDDPRAKITIGAGDVLLYPGDRRVQAEDMKDGQWAAFHCWSARVSDPVLIPKHLAMLMSQRPAGSNVDAPLFPPTPSGATLPITFMQMLDAIWGGKYSPDDRSNGRLLSHTPEEVEIIRQQEARILGLGEESSRDEATPGKHGEHASVGQGEPNDAKDIVKAEEQETQTMSCRIVKAEEEETQTMPCTIVKVEEEGTRDETRPKGGDDRIAIQRHHAKNLNGDAAPHSDKELAEPLPPSTTATVSPTATKRVRETTPNNSVRLTSRVTPSYRIEKSQKAVAERDAASSLRSIKPFDLPSSATGAGATPVLATQTPVPPTPFSLPHTPDTPADQAAVYRRPPPLRQFDPPTILTFEQVREMYEKPGYKPLPVSTTPVIYDKYAALARYRLGVEDIYASCRICHSSTNNRKIDLCDGERQLHLYISISPS